MVVLNKDFVVDKNPNISQERSLKILSKNLLEVSDLGLSVSLLPEEKQCQTKQRQCHVVS